MIDRNQILQIAKLTEDPNFRVGHIVGRDEFRDLVNLALSTTTAGMACATESELMQIWTWLGGFAYADDAGRQTAVIPQARLLAFLRAMYGRSQELDRLNAKIENGGLVPRG
jgi:hypothetical protein